MKTNYVGRKQETTMKLMKYLKRASAVTAAAAITVTTAISASAADSADFFAKGAQKDANGNKPGYVDLAALPNGSFYQSKYNELYDICVELWNSSDDIEPFVFEGEDEDGHPVEYREYPIALIDLTEILPADFDREEPTAEQVQDLMCEGYKIIMPFCADNPLFYFVDHYSCYLMGDEDGSVALEVCAPEEYAKGADRARIQSQIKDFYGQAASKTEGKETLAQKHMALYKYLCDNMTYAFEKDENGNYVVDEDGYRIINDAPYCHNIVGPAVYKEGVCESYARAYELLCNYAGLDVVYSDGMALDAENGEFLGGHAWDFIKLDDGRFYGIDCTWDDEIMEDAELSSDAEYALNMTDGYSYYYFGDGKTRFGSEHADCDHNTQTTFGGDVPIDEQGHTMFFKAMNMFLYEIDNIAGVTRETYDYYTPGDVNCDFEFDMRDLIRLGKYTVDNRNLISKGAANADGTGAINMADAVYLQKSLLGYENSEPKVDTQNYPARK